MCFLEREGIWLGYHLVAALRPEHQSQHTPHRTRLVQFRDAYQKDRVETGRVSTLSKCQGHSQGRRGERLSRPRYNRDIRLL